MAEPLAGHLLVVCTANRCRSPMLEVLARSQFADAGLAIDVRSGGVLPGGEPATDRAIATMQEYGLDLSVHRSHQLSNELVGWADLVVVMERRHLAKVVEIDPAALRRSFVFGEVPRWIAEATTVPSRPTALRDLAASWNERRPVDEILVDDPRDDLDDPIGRSRRHYRQCAVRLDEWLHDVIAGMFGFHK
jgi:protein-tyrosine phosphatase